MASFFGALVFAFWLGVQVQAGYPIEVRGDLLTIGLDVLAILVYGGWHLWFRFHEREHAYLYEQQAEMVRYHIWHATDLARERDELLAERETENALAGEAVDLVLEAHDLRVSLAAASALLRQAQDERRAARERIKTAKHRIEGDNPLWHSRSCTCCIARKALDYALAALAGED